MARDRITRSTSAASVVPAEAAVFFEEALGDSVADAPEILDGLQNLIWAMNAQAEAADETPAYLIRLWVDHLEILRARVRCLAEKKAHEAVA